MGKIRAMTGRHTSRSRRDAIMGLGQNLDALVQNCDDEHCLSVAVRSWPEVYKWCSFVWSWAEVYICSPFTWQRTSAPECLMPQPLCRPQGSPGSSTHCLAEPCWSGLGTPGAAGAFFGSSLWLGSHPFLPLCLGGAQARGSRVPHLWHGAALCRLFKNYLVLGKEQLGKHLCRSGGASSSPCSWLPS